MAWRGALRTAWAITTCSDTSRPTTAEVRTNQLTHSGVQRVGTLTLADVVMAILESRASYPLAASAALVREGDGTAVHLVLLDEKQQPLFAAPGVIIAVTYEAERLDSDVVAAFGGRNVIILK